MPRLALKHSAICSAILLFACFDLAPAQQAALATNPSGNPYFKSIDLKGGKKRTMDFSVGSIGTVRGRVFADDESNRPTAEAESQGISGVKITLRSRDAGFERFLIEQYSDDNGAYRFDDLRPGKYTIEIDPLTLPAKFRVPDEASPPVDAGPKQGVVLNIPVGPQRMITGNVFLDRNKDGKFDSAKDLPVDGALISVDGSLAVSDSKGAYAIKDLPGGRISLVVRWPQRPETTHVILDLGSGPVANRVVNVPLSR